MPRRNKETKEGERFIQDGARSPRSSSRLSKQAEWGMDTADRLAKYARDSSPQRSRDKRHASNRYQALGDPDSMEEGSEREEAPPRDSMRQDGRSSERGGTRTHMSPLQEERSEPTLADVLHAVNKSNQTLSSLQTQFETFKEDIYNVRCDIQKVAERATRMETRISELEDHFTPIQKSYRQQSQQIATLMAKTDDLENRSRRNNIRLVGIPEKAEGTNPPVYFETWLQEVFGKESLSPHFAIERAHRVPLRPLAPGAPPRPVLIKLLHFRDRDVILRKARDLQDILLNGSRVSFYPDFSAEVQKRRMQFQDIKRRLRNLHVPYAMLYPARFRVAALGSTHFFETAKDAVNWLDRHEQQLKNLPPEAPGDEG